MAVVPCHIQDGNSTRRPGFGCVVSAGLAPGTGKTGSPNLIQPDCSLASSVSACRMALSVPARRSQCAPALALALDPARQACRAAPPFAELRAARCKRCALNANIDVSCRSSSASCSAGTCRVSNPRTQPHPMTQGRHYSPVPPTERAQLRTALRPAPLVGNRPKRWQTAHAGLTST